MSFFLHDSCGVCSPASLLLKGAGKLSCITAGSLNVLPVMPYWTARGKFDKHSLNVEIDQTATLSVMPALA